MPKVYRAMLKDGDHPRIGSSATTLGVRVPVDIAPDAAGLVRRAIGGMSVSPSLRQLPPHRVPERLQHLVPEASGRDNLVVWSMGEGPFVDARLADRLWLRPDPANSSHGFVEPEAEVSLKDYQQALADTRPLWRIDEA